VSLVFMGLAVAAKADSQVPIERYDVPGNIAQACYGTWFYFGKTLLPLDLIASYPIPSDMNWRAPRFLLSIIGTLAISAGLFLQRRRWPELLAAWLSYLVILAPTSGIVRISNQLAADRYSYIAMLGFVAVLAAGLCQLWQLSLRARPAVVLMLSLSLGTLLGLIYMTWNQCRIWHDSKSLWSYALNHGAGSNSWVAHGNLALDLTRQGLFEEAVAHSAEAARLNPNDVHVCNNYAMTLASSPYANIRDGKKAVAAATRVCELTQWKNPDYLDTLAAAFAEVGDFDAAIKWQIKAIEILRDERNREVFRSRLALYQAGKPYREPIHGAPPAEARP
jgi:tetratricopeptide (TPR) repeat protein